MNRSFKFTTLLLLTITFLGSANVQAKELVVGIGDLDYPPFYFKANGKIRGAAAEIAKHISDKLGHKLIFKRFPWKRVQYNLEIGKIDMMILYFKSPEREKHAIFADIPHINESSYLFVKMGKKIPYNGTLKNLANYKFANVKGYSHGKIYDKANYLKKTEATNETILIRILLGDRIDIALGNKATILHHARKENVVSEINFLTPPIDIGPNYFAFSKKRNDAKQLSKDFTAVLKKFKNTKKYKNILKKYGFDVAE